MPSGPECIIFLSPNNFGACSEPRTYTGNTIRKMVENPKMVKGSTGEYQLLSSAHILYRIACAEHHQLLFRTTLMFKSQV